MESFTVDIHRAEGRKLNVPLMAPFTIATSRLEGVENVSIRVELSNGCCGWGEAPILPFVTVEDQTAALTKAAEACHFLKQTQPMSLGDLLTEVAQLLPGHAFASVRAGVEMAVIDAAATSIGTPLWRFFGGVSNTITTDITIRNEKARRYLNDMRKKQPVPFTQKFSNADPLALKLLERLIAFDPKDHPSAEEFGKKFIKFNFRKLELT